MLSFQSQLVPFESGKAPPVNIHCRGTTDDHKTLNITFTLSGHIDDIAIDTLAERGHRTDELWKKTCFEIFIKSDCSDQYWEYNLSPSSNWAVYGFQNYRESRFDELSADHIDINCDLTPNQFILNCVITLPAPLFDQNLFIGLSSVVQVKNGNIYYYALKHVSDQPDFHARESFIVRIPKP